MHRILFCTILALFARPALAQVELKTDPLALIFSNYKLYADIGVSEKWSIEPSVGYLNRKIQIGEGGWSRERTSGRVIGKYYFSPKNGIDGFHIGPYAQYRKGARIVNDGQESVNTERVAIGFYFGYKIATAKGFVFDAGCGLGRAIFSQFNGADVSKIPFANIDGITRLSIGFRFGGGSPTPAKKAPPKRNPKR